MVLKRLACGYVIVSLSLFVCLSESSLWGAEVEILHNVIQEFVFRKMKQMTLLYNTEISKYMISLVKSLQKAEVTFMWFTNSSIITQTRRAMR